jgi:hypothetical protein
MIIEEPTEAFGIPVETVYNATYVWMCRLGMVSLIRFI